MALKLTGNLTRKWNMLEHTPLHPRAWDRGGSSHRGCPTSAGTQSSQARLEPAHGHLLLLQVGREGTLESKSILNKSMQSQAPGRAAPSPPARSKIIAELLLLLLLPGGRRPWGWKRNQQSVCTFWGCLVQYKWNQVGCSHTASTSPISGRRRWDQVDLGTYW